MVKRLRVSLRRPEFVVSAAVWCLIGTGGRVTAVGAANDRNPARPAKATARAVSNSSRTTVWSRAAWTLTKTSPRAQILDLALSAASCAARSGLVEAPKTLTVIDYSVRSTEPRLWVLELSTGRTLHHELVAHGQGSGLNLPTVFSNQPDSHQSSLGLFVTAETYVGQHGYSLRLDGLDAGFNDRARERAIVIHGAAYVSPEIARAQGRLGRSWGCPALGENVAKDVIDQIKGGDLVFAYYPDRAWLNGSPLLGNCSAPADL